MDAANAPEPSPEPAPPSTCEKTKFVTQYLAAKGQQWKEWKALRERTGPLTLLELPIDILRLIVKEITHTNDLTSLALTNSALYNLAVPLIYSRFDIVWPDGHVASTESKSVDALTYGLSTLCLGSAFARTTRRAFHPSAPPLSRFGGNEYARYTKKFSLGNGPNDWVAEYMITKESGKMLVTLVALAVAKMKNLETFVWDMPTGVLSDIFMSLASLDGQTDNPCKLNRVWIRWHDNSESFAALPPSPAAMAAAAAAAIVPLGSHLTPVGIMLPANASHPAPRGPVPYSEHHCEYPTFSVLPPLKSLTVLDIDEVAYVDEMAVLIERSKDCLQELRVGISAKSSPRDWVQTWDGAGLHQIDHQARWPGESTIGERRLGGVLGVLVGKIYDIRKRNVSRPRDKATATNEVLPTQTPNAPVIPTSLDIEDGATHPATPAPATSPSQPAEAQPIDGDGTVLQREDLAKAQAPTKMRRPSKCSPVDRKRLEGKLKLQTLELERVPLSMQVCRYAIDWSTLTSLTLLECAQHEHLWRVLRKQFQPTPLTSSSFGAPYTSKSVQSGSAMQYHLALKYIHTDLTTAALITFIKETLAPNTLEVLFLQDRRRGPSPPPVPIAAIFKGALKRHRSSLQKLLLDSSAKPTQGNQAVSDTVRWQNWTLTTEVLLYLTSGRMANLRELAASLDYKDWHTFLQRLPNVPQLRSVNIPHIVDYIGSYEPKELALQIADIITLRPEIRLCYVGIGTKCFEILEARDNGSGRSSGSTSPVSTVDHTSLPGNVGINSTGMSVDDVGEQEEEDTSDEEMDDDQTDDEEADVDDSEVSDDGFGDDDENAPTTATNDPDETQSDNDAAPADHDSDDDDDSFLEPDAGRVKLRLREILFYDDKVAIFRARHGKL